jgi:hypothetical protein
MNCAAQIVFNNLNYEQPSDAYIMMAGVFVTRPNGTIYKYGYEEWNRQKLLLNNKIAYVESYRRHLLNPCKKLMLYYKDPNHGNDFFHYATLYNVEQLSDNNIQNIKINLNNAGWQAMVQGHFNNPPINDLGPIGLHPSYLAAFDSNNIVTQNPNPGFIVNLEYERIDVLKKPVNLSKMDNEDIINSSWRRLSVRYYIDNLNDSLNDNNPLKEYLDNF